MTLQNMLGDLALDATLAALSAKIPAQVGGMLPVNADGSTVAISGTVPVSMAATPGLTDTQLRATAVPVSGTFWQATQPVSAAALPLPAGASTEATLSAMNAKLPALSGGTVPVSMAETPGLTDAQLRATAVPVSGTFWQATQPVSAAALPLPTGASTEATLAALNGKLGTLGQNVASGSAPVVLASDQPPVQTVEPALILTGQGGQTAVINNILGNPAGSTGTDVANYRSASVQVVSTGTAGTFIFEQSNDGTNWVALPVFNAALTTAVPIVAAITATASAIIYSIPLRCRFARLRIATLITGGSVQAVSRLSTEPWTPTVAAVAQPTAASLNATVSGTVTATVTAGTVNPVVPATPYILNSLATTNIALILTGTSGLQAFYATNTGAAAAYVKLYNKATAPVLATDVPAMILVVPAAVGGVPGVCTLPIGFSGFRFALGLGIAVTGGAADTDATAVAAGQVKVILSRTV